MYIHFTAPVGVATTSTTIYQQPTTILTQPFIQSFGAVPVQTVCPTCRASIVTSITFEVGTLVWVAGFIIFLMGYVIFHIPN